MTTTPEREEFEAQEKAYFAWSKIAAAYPTHKEAFLAGWHAAARQSAPESCAKVDDCTESLCMQANRCKHTMPTQPQRLCVEQSEDRRDAERWRAMRQTYVGWDWEWNGELSIAAFQLKSAVVGAGPEGADDLADAAIAAMKA